MYSGSDSTESQNYPQWALNPATYQNMSNDQVDWAALAQQWIIMKEAGPPPVVPPEHKPKPKKEPLNEGGEAPMDVENDKDDSIEWKQGEWNQSWGWNNTWTPPTAVPPPKPPLLPTPGNFNQYDSANDNANFAGTGSNDYASGYWTSVGSSKQVKPHNRRFSKVNVPRPIQPTVAEAQPPLDAAKRKQLPAWIREGLEKMEKDKLKQMEREKEKQERDEYNEKIKQSEKETMEILKSTIKEQQKSRFESDAELSDEDVPEVKKILHLDAHLTPAEQMMSVRRTMTEILLKVTNHEIETICREELQRHHKKYKASDRRVSAPSGAYVTASLGLGIYGGSGSSSCSENDDEDAVDRKDSDAELKDSIKRKRAEFSKTEKLIEDKLAEAENKKQEVGKSPTPDANDNDTQVDAKVQGGRKQRIPSTHSKSSVKRTKSRSSSSSSDSVYSRKRGRHSSTSSSGRDSKKSTKKTRSRTPDRRSHKSKRKRSRSRSEQRTRGKYRRSRSRSRSSSYRRRNRRSRSRSRRRRSRSSSSGRGKRSRRR